MVGEDDLYITINHCQKGPQAFHCYNTLTIICCALLIPVCFNFMLIFSAESDSYVIYLLVNRIDCQMSCELLKEFWCVA